MIDKLALRIPGSTRLRLRFALQHDRLISSGSSCVRPSKHYLRAVDLRPLGLPVLLHERCQMDKQGNHKLEFFEVGGLGYSAIVATVKRIFEIDPLQLSLMRLDLAADVPGYAPSWFREHVRVAYKRHTAELGEWPAGETYAAIGNVGIETLYWGKRPGLIRAYDKVAERRVQYAKLQRAARRANPPGNPLPFEEVYGHPSTGVVLTRVECEYGSSKVPVELQTLGRLREAADFNPFSALKFTPGGESDPNPENYSLKDYLAGIGLRKLVAELGFARARAFMNKRSRSNAARILKRFGAFLPVTDSPPPDLFAIYRESIGRQLAA